MALTALQVYLDPPEGRGTSLPFDGLIEYCRNERGKEVARLCVMTTPSDGTQAGEQITIYMTKARRKRTEEVVQARTVFTIPPGPMPVGGYAFSWDLREVKFSATKPFPIVRRGDYFFSVEHTGGTTGPSAVEATSEDFRVAVMTTDRLEAEWLLGATRRSNDDRAVRYQPRLVTGVRIIEVSKNHPLDLFPLKLSYGSEAAPVAFLSWASGETVNIDTSIPGGIQRQYLLATKNRKHYVIVQVDPRRLPLSDTLESLMVDRQLIDRESLRRWIDEEAEWLESSFLHTTIEPALIVTDYTMKTYDPAAGSGEAPPLPDNFDFDIKTAPLTYFPPTSGHWINWQLPYGFPLHFDYLVGALESSRIVDIPVDWIEVCSARQIQLLPFNQSLAYSYIGLMYVYAVRGPIELPSFWRCRYYAGVANETVPLELIEALGMRAASKSLTILGQMYRGGFSSQSISRDGVSESVGYTASAMYGIYSASINDLNNRLKELLPQLKRKYYGLTLEVL